MNASRRILEISEPLIDTLARRARALEARGADIVNLGQAIPGDAPPREAIEAARRALGRPAVNVYAPDAGIPELRQATAAWVARHDGIRLDPDTQIIITAGGNQALLMALQCCTDAGDRVLLPTPYFMNHEMAVRLVDGVGVEVPTTVPDEGAERGCGTGVRHGVRTGVRHGVRAPWVITARRIEQESNYKAVVITTPNNPTGAVVPRREIERIARVCARRGATLILDRTYAGFEYERPPEPARLKPLPPNVLIAGSFSKVFSMTGWRVGYLAASKEMLREALKAQDTMIICAPVISQIAVTAALKARRGVAPAYLRELRRRRDYVQERLQAMRGWSAVPAAGAFFTFIRVAGMRDSIAFVNELLEKTHVLMLPGRIFGRAGEGHVRLSYGVADIRTLGAAFDRLGRG